MINSKLAISIPTYNRPSILRENLLIMMPEIKKYNIPIYISDDSDNDLTRDMIFDLKQQYNNIQYHKNEPSLGHDENCLMTLRLAKEEYIWYLGDSQIIAGNGIEMILDTIKENTFDFILVSSVNRNVKVNSQVYFDFTEFFIDLTWHATLTGATIYRNAILFKSEYNNYINSNFIQLGIILEEILDSNNGLCWINKELLYHNKNKGESYWTSNTFKVFAEDWYNFISTMPDDYSVENKIKVIKSHSDNTGIFKIRNYFKLRARNILNLKSYLKYYKELKYTTSLNIYIVFILTLIPSFVFSKLEFLYKQIKSK